MKVKKEERVGGVCEGGRGVGQACLRQCDMAHAINSGSVERPCLAICSGSGTFARVGVTSTPTDPPTHTHTHTETKSLPPPPFPSSPDRHPAGPACISIKQLQANLLPCWVGGVKKGVGLRRALLNNGLSDEKALGELDVHYKRATSRRRHTPPLLHAHSGRPVVRFELGVQLPPPPPIISFNLTSFLLTPLNYKHYDRRVWRAAAGRKVTALDSSGGTRGDAASPKKKKKTHCKF